MSIEKTIQSKVPLDLATKTVINLMYTSRLMEERLAHTLKPYDLTVPQFNVMRILRGQAGKPASLSTIQERMVDKNSNTTRLVDKLIKKEWVIRQVCPSNRRMVEIEITPKGLEILEELDPISKEINATSVDALCIEKLEELNTLLDQLRKEE